MRDYSIIIRPSDKGSQVVILDAKEYKELVIDTLTNDETYKETNITLDDIKKRVT